MYYFFQCKISVSAYINSNVLHIESYIINLSWLIVVTFKHKHIVFIAIVTTIFMEFSTLINPQERLLHEKQIIINKNKI